MVSLAMQGTMPATAPVPTPLEASHPKHGVMSALGSWEGGPGLGELSPPISSLPLQSVDSEDSFVPGRRASQIGRASCRERVSSPV